MFCDDNYFFKKIQKEIEESALNTYKIQLGNFQEDLMITNQNCMKNADQKENSFLINAKKISDGFQILQKSEFENDIKNVSSQLIHTKMQENNLTKYSK